MPPILPPQGQCVIGVNIICFIWQRDRENMKLFIFPTERGCWSICLSVRTAGVEGVCVFVCVLGGWGDCCVALQSTIRMLPWYQPQEAATVSPPPQLLKLDCLAKYCSDNTSTFKRQSVITDSCRL